MTAKTKPRILVVDDSPLDRKLASRLLGRSGAWDVVTVTDGEEALRAIAESRPDLVLTDLMMPRVDGIQLVKEVRSRHPKLPVVLMTAHGSEETAALALREGAASYVPKRQLARDLVETVSDVLELARLRGASTLEELTQLDCRFVLGNDLSQASPVIRYLETVLQTMGICNDAERLQIGVALREALANAAHHGNLELVSQMRDDAPEAYAALRQQRLKAAPYASRRVTIEASHRRNHVSYRVTDEGPGFDPSGIPDPTDMSNLGRAHGRGLMLIGMFMDDVRHHGAGNVIEMVKRGVTGSEGS